MSPTVEERLAVVENQVRNLDTDITKMASQVSALYDRLGQRPSWAVTLALSTLASLVVGLAVAFASTVGP